MWLELERLTGRLGEDKGVGKAVAVADDARESVGDVCKLFFRGTVGDGRTLSEIVRKDGVDVEGGPLVGSHHALDIFEIVGQRRYLCVNVLLDLIQCCKMCAERASHP